MATQLKALATSTNSRAELNDLYGSVVYETLNTAAPFYQKVRKVKTTSDRIGFRVRSAANSTADSYEELDTIVTGNSTRQRIYFPIKQVKVGVEISGLMEEAAKGTGGIGDIMAQEMRDAANDLGKEIDTQLLGTADPNSSNDISGLTYLIDSGSNYTTYGSVSTRTDTGYEWAVANIDEDSEDLSLSLMRNMITTCLDDGARFENLLFLTNATQVAKFKDLVQNLQRTVPTSSKVGFTGMPEFDGVPVMDDVNVPSGYMFLLDMSTIQMGVLKEPTIEQLPEPKDASAAYIKMYAQLYCTNPKVNYKKTGLST